MGYYQGLGGRLIVQTDFLPAKVQAAPVVTPGIGTVTCPWSPTLTLNITKDWLPGCYLLKLVGDGGEEQFVPLTIRDDTSTASYVLQNSVTTWQAYNLWGSYSLYYGPDSQGRGTFADRARAVSFDRPYPQTWASGAADFVGNELPLLFHLESLGLDMTYWTDVDLHARPQLLMNHRCLFSMGHDEYWSTPMRQGAAHGQRQRRQPGLPRRQRLLPPDPAPIDLCRPQSPGGLLQGRRRGPDRQPAAGAHHGQLEPGTAQQSRVDPHRFHVPVGRGQGRHGGHRRVVVVLRRVQPHRRPHLQHRHPRRVRPLRPVPPRTEERRRARPLACPGPSQLVRHHLLHGAGERRGRAGQRLGQLRVAAREHRGDPSQRHRPSPSPG